MQKPPKFHSFNGKKYRITRDVLDGFVDHPESYSHTFRELNCSERMKGFDELETWIHESIHASYPSKKETEVRQAGYDIARLLWRLGYRKNK